MTAWKARLGDRVSAAFALLGPLRAASGCRVLMYHAVGGEVSGDAQRLYSIEPERFASHVRCIAGALGASTVALGAGVAAGRGLAITFDDGYRNNLTVAAPLLVDANLPFTVFVTSDFVSDAQPQYLSQAELQELARLPGVTIGAHGRSHRPLTECNDKELADELAGSRGWLEDLLGRPVTTMSYPHGAVDARVRAAVAEASYEVAACSRFGAHRFGDDPLLVARNDIWAEDSTARLLAKAAGHWDWMAWCA
jgi:peptidoglycan/xylan/chitin deacetylase (PgdA/CDA1 family)